MNNIISDFLSKFDFPSWMIGSLLWAVFAGTVAVLVKLAWAVIKAMIISKKLLKNNRNTKGNGYGKYYADKFLEVWYSKIPLTYNYGVQCRVDVLFPKYFLTGVAEEELLKCGLIIISESTKENRKILLPVRSLRNKIIVRIIKFYLVYFIGDSPGYYEQLEKNK